MVSTAEVTGNVSLELTNIMPMWAWILAVSLLLLVFLFLLFRKLFMRIRAGLIKKLVYTRSFSASGAHVGQAVKLTEVIENRSFLPIFRVEIGFYAGSGLEIDGIKGETKHGMTFFTGKFNLMPRCRVTRVHKVKCMSRGVFALTTAESFANNDNIYFESKAELCVYPAEVNISKELFGNISVCSAVFAKGRNMPDPFSFTGVREYALGDPFSHINFHASASFVSRGLPTLAVNRFDSSAELNVMIYLDFTIPRGSIVDGEKYNKLMERGLSLAASIAEYSAKNGGRVGFAANTKSKEGRLFINLPPTGGVSSVRQILDNMAAIQNIEGMSFKTLIDKNTPQSLSGCSVCIISCGLDAEAENRIRRLRMQNLEVNILPLSIKGA